MTERERHDQIVSISKAMQRKVQDGAPQNLQGFRKMRDAFVRACEEHAFMVESWREVPPAGMFCAAQAWNPDLGQRALLLMTWSHSGCAAQVDILEAPERTRTIH